MFHNAFPQILLQVLSEALFERFTDPSNNLRYAYRQTHLIGGRPYDFYLTPDNTGGVETVKAVWDGKGPAGKYYFTNDPTTYPN